MRDILFRGFYENKNGTEKVFCGGKWHKGKWVEGCYFMAKDNKYNILHYISEIKGEQIFKIIPETLGQYTGKNDINGNNIFENHIVKDCNGNIGVIVFGTYNYNPITEDFHIGFYIHWQDTKLRKRGLRKDLGFWVSDGLKIIGNIHSNPELLEME